MQGTYCGLGAVCVTPTEGTPRRWLGVDQFGTASRMKILRPRE